MNAADTPAFLTATGAPADVEKAMFARFSATTGLHNVVSNTIRKSATTNYLNDPVEKHNEASTMDHGAKTAQLTLRSKAISGWMTRTEERS